MKQPWEWTEEDIAGLIANKVQEHLGLDYKAYAALAKDDEKPCVRISNVESSLRRCN
jgi:hypothetical protein